LLFTNPIPIGPLTGEELRAAIEVPARRVGLAFEPGLADRLLADVADDPGALTLLQFVLDELWRDQRDGYLTHASYRQIGGAAHALANYADAAIDYFSKSDQDIARGVLLQLVEFGDGTARRRRPVEILELIGGEGMFIDVSDARHVVEQLIDQRLLATTSTAKGQLQVELAHDALIDTWPRLKQWIDESRGALQARSRLGEAAREWEALGRDVAVLLPTERLDKLLPTIGEIPLTELERQYIAACEDHARARRKRAASRTGLVSATTGLVVALITIAVTAFVDSGNRNGSAAISVAAAAALTIAAVAAIWTFLRSRDWR
jgi:hypothetical protein